jgi:hypothetical protein
MATTTVTLKDLEHLAERLLAQEPPVRRPAGVTERSTALRQAHKPVVQGRHRLRMQPGRRLA